MQNNKPQKDLAFMAIVSALCLLWALAAISFCAFLALAEKVGG